MFFRRMPRWAALFAFFTRILPSIFPNTSNFFLDVLPFAMLTKSNLGLKLTISLTKTFPLCILADKVISVVIDVVNTSSLLLSGSRTYNVATASKLLVTWELLIVKSGGDVTAKSISNFELGCLLATFLKKDATQRLELQFVSKRT